MKNVESMFKDLINERRETTNELERVVGPILDAIGDLVTNVRGIGEMIRLTLADGRVELDFWVTDCMRISGYINFTQSEGRPVELLETANGGDQAPGFSSIPVCIRHAASMARKYGSYAQALERERSHPISATPVTASEDSSDWNDNDWDFGPEDDCS